MRNQDSSNAVTGVIEVISVNPRPMTDDDSRNESIYRTACLELADLINNEGQPKAEWDDPLKRRVALEYLRATILGVRGDFIRFEKVIYVRRGDTFDDDPSHEVELNPPWITRGEVEMLNMLVDAIYNGHLPLR